MGGIQSILLAIIVFIYYKDITYMYTALPELTVLIYPAMKFYALYQLTDGYKSVMCGVMRGLSQ
jgi:Na+-driven multidrug efflux pump